MDVRYPIGKFEFTKGDLSTNQLDSWINDIEQLPHMLRAVVQELSNEQLDTQYRPEGWTIRQVVHHLADTNVNAYVRFKLALTADNPIINPFDESKWAELTDSKLPVEISLSLLDTLHIRWCQLLRNLNEEDWQKTLTHPISGQSTLAENIGFFAWHGKHHLAHITSCCNRMDW